jgi:hypothetical protein
MNSELARIVNTALVALPSQVVPSEQEISDTVQRLCMVFGATAEVQAAAIKQVLARRLVRMDTGFSVVEGHLPWLDARRPHIDPFYWDRYKLMLQKEWAPQVLTSFDRATDEILDLMGNPAQDLTWKRRGLVMGDVQSGKTATYAGLICKAADAGYRFIVLLTGTIENLRRQTQTRLDISFVGFDSSELLKRNGRDISVGVGLLDGRRKATVFTSSQADFVASKLDQGLHFGALREPALVVVKKHGKILDNLSHWIRSYNMASKDGTINTPTLIIDDEADNASLNTNDEEASPTRVNERIRTLLSQFRQTTYVGFTATPFANIFVDPDSSEDMLGDDLFPRDFIYTLNAPSNYFGPRKIFGGDSDSQRPIRAIPDIERSLPVKHKSTHHVSHLPESMLTALRLFCLANAIRDLRGDSTDHRSMLVNVSQFTNVQDQIEVLLRVVLEHYKTAIRNFSQLAWAVASQDPYIAALRQTFDQEYKGCGYEWQSVQRALHNAVLPITTKAVNQRTGPNVLDYRVHRETGLRVIAVGGNSLSRGLTLEGLVVSYFCRSTKMYDTLLQMGRWFGYRPNYEDLCRVYLPDEATEWYGHISEVTDELRAELKRMSNLGMTPKDFGLAVRAHPESLLVTARNKMRTSTEITRTVSLNAQAFESVELSGRVEVLRNNAEAVDDLVSQLLTTSSEPSSGQWLFSDVASSEIANFLRRFQVPATEFRFQPQAIAELLQGHKGDELARWDVLIPGLEGNVERTTVLADRRFKSQIRTVRYDKAKCTYTISGDKRRVGSRGVERAGLSPEQIANAEAAARAAAKDQAAADGTPVPDRISVADHFYRRARSRPLMIIHPIAPREISGDDWQPLPSAFENRFVAIGLSFPVLANEPERAQVKYKINLVKAREILGTNAEQGDDIEPVEVES